MQIKDDIFSSAVIRVAPGTTVVWTQSGRNPHTVTADDNSWTSPLMKRGDVFARRFDAPGRYPYHCTYHGVPGGHGMTGIVLVGDEAVAEVERPPVPTRTGPQQTLAVPGDFPTIQAAVDAAAPASLPVLPAEGSATAGPAAAAGAAAVFRAPHVMGVAAVAPWWSTVFGLYAYLMPVILYACWVAVAVWDLVRRDDRTLGPKLLWLAVVLLVPGLGPVAYYVLGSSPIPAGMRWGLVAGGLAAYLAVAGLALATAL